ncbi:MutS domain V [Ruminococcaceae bacterium YRB3002]|nr:MutS domain V [Ruminococcaceae bacterium YRB3002]
MDPKTDEYLKKAEGIAEAISSLEHISSMISIGRIITFALSAFCLIFGYIKGFVWLGIIGVVVLAGFILLCRIHNRINNDRDYLKAYRKVCLCYSYRVAGDYDSLLESRIDELDKQKDKTYRTSLFTGEIFTVNDHDYCVDLGLFGKKSIFSLYNVCETVMGRRRFADRLLHASADQISRADLKLVQEACEELISHVESMQEFQAFGRMGFLSESDADIRGFLKYDYGLKPVTKAVYKFMPLLWLVPVIFLFVLPDFVRTAVLGVIVVNILFWVFGGIRGGKIIPGGVTIRKINNLKALYDHAESQEYKSGYLNELIRCGRDGDRKVSDSLGELSGILGAAELRVQPLFAVLLNMIFPLDYLLLDLIDKWKAKNSDITESVLDNIGEIETLMSMAQAAFTSERYVFPEFVESDDPADNAYFDGINICHPLLRPATRVSNSVKLDSDIAMITGSNMSGKTTLIRTVGVCALLAYMGGPVPAESLKLGKMRIMSSMRVVDSLEENMSTFKAELVRIAGIAEAGREGRPLLFLIDEIFRGTNSDDRTEGAYSVLKSLSKPHICGLMTTHDYALVDRTENRMDGIVYYYFKEQYNDTDIVFDYVLRSGISRSSNARFLMRLVGIEDGGEN